MTCANAAYNGHLELLKWAREHDCPWDGQTRRYAAEQGHTVLLRWAEENGCPLADVEADADDISEEDSSEENVVEEDWMRWIQRGTRGRRRRRASRRRIRSGTCTLPLCRTTYRQRGLPTHV